jgi:hypothetical protein
MGRWYWRSSISRIWFHVSIDRSDAGQIEWSMGQRGEGDGTGSVDQEDDVTFTWDQKRNG